LLTALVEPVEIDIDIDKYLGLTLLCDIDIDIYFILLACVIGSSASCIMRNIFF